MSNRAMQNFNIASFEVENMYGFPELFPVKKPVNCDKWIDFETARTKRDTSCAGLHFFIDDYKFQCLWNSPKRYIDFLARRQCVVMPDFSMYTNFPLALQIYNKYRNHWLAAYYSINGVRIIPCVLCNRVITFPWLLSGLPENSVVAISDIGVGRGEDRRLFEDTYNVMHDKLRPIQILYFTRSSNIKPPDPECTVIKLPFLKGGE